MSKFYAFITTLTSIGLAEMGDKTQILVLCMSMKYSSLDVLIIISQATMILMGIAVLAGNFIVKYIPSFYIQVFAGILFILLGTINLIKKDDAEECDNNFSRLKIFLTFFLSELGDKTQIATFIFSMKFKEPFFVWLGATSGMILANILAISLAQITKKFISYKIIKIVSSIIFIVIGITTLLRKF